MLLLSRSQQLLPWTLSLWLCSAQLLKEKLKPSSQVASRWRGLHLLNIVVLEEAADGLFGLYGSEHWDETLIGTRSRLLPPSPPPPQSLTIKPYVASLDIKHHGLGGGRGVGGWEGGGGGMSEAVS